MIGKKLCWTKYLRKSFEIFYNHPLAFMLALKGKKRNKVKTNKTIQMVQSFILIFFLRWISFEIYFSEIEMLRERHEILPELYYSFVSVIV